MSGGGAVTNLEEFFLSRAFGGSGAARRRLELDDLWVVAVGAQGDLSPPATLDCRFGSSTFGQLPEEREDVPLDMNKPIATVLAFTPQTPAGRQRALAALGGLAAAALVVVGVTSGITHGTGAGQNQQALARNGGAHLPPLDAPPAGRGASSGVAGLLAAERGRDDHGARAGAATLNATPGVHGSFSVFGGAAGGSSPSGGSARSSGGASGSGTTSVTTPLPAASNTVATVLDPVSQLASNATATVSTTTQQINAIVPSATPITGMVNDVGTTVSGLTGTLAGPNA